MSGQLPCSPTPAAKPPVSRLPTSTRRPAPIKMANPEPAAPGPAAKRFKMGVSSNPPYGGLRRSVSSDNLFTAGRNPITARSNMTKTAMVKPMTSHGAKPSTQVKKEPLVSHSNRSNIRRAESTMNVAAKRVVGTAGMRKAESHANVADLNSMDDNFQPPAPKKGKRQPWDLKGRIQDQEEAMQLRDKANEEMKRALMDNQLRLMQLESEKNVLKMTVQEKETCSAVAATEVDALKRQLGERDSQLAEKDRHLRDIERTLFDHKTTLMEKEAQLAAKSNQIARNLEEVANGQETIANMASGMATLKVKMSTVELKFETTSEDLRAEREKTAFLEEAVKTLEAKILRDEQLRRKMHNQIQELKGNIRVFVRIRPFLKSEVGDAPLDKIPHILKPDPSVQTVELIKPTGKPSAMSRTTPAESKSLFTFDAVLMPSADQVQVFSEVSQLVQSALDGYNVCIFAYGQTGAGKTWTMEGRGEGPDMGIIPRSIYQIFETMGQLKSTGWTYTLKGMFVEIYNETLQDLLSKKGKKLEIKSVEGKKDETYVSNLKYVEITSEEQIFKLLLTAQQNRAVAATNCNERSSRSHFVFQLQLQGTNSQTGETNNGTLNLVDLAGSERLKESLSEGDRLTETKNINKSLSNLGNVIMALAQKNPHVPYRNSRLTHLLANSLGGNSKTLMLVNISPREEYFNESLNSLRFATKVNQCHIGTATKKVKPT